MARLSAGVAARASAANSRLADAAGSRPIVITYIGFRLIKGVIVVAPHMGSWELAAASWAASFGEIGVMVEQIEPRRLFEHVSTLRSRMNIRVIPLSRTGARDIMRMLKEHRMVVLAMDRDILNTGQRYKFFGRPTSFPTGPVEIALKTGAPILPAFCIRDRSDAYVAIGEAPMFLTR